ncbi:SseB family protein [Rhodanobacter sp. MP7CTX1]|uniref:SseB family protein n=1 Tax=Rhodanobacter sp. MP7CTX1 TaxID=2723084 RepID=UPI001616423D|nr:SseB family protein [Rhodanobacter sp. MP7CTX1]MBB6186669.1 hypothetical protein [Rhodanobacter sp. MP7CTX1]
MSDEHHDPLGEQIDAGFLSENGELDFLDQLSTSTIVAILRCPPGPGEADPRHNLVEWGYTDGRHVVPLFTSTSRGPPALPSPATYVRVHMLRLLLSTNKRRFVINPLSPVKYEISDFAYKRLQALAAADPEFGSLPSHDSPWVFRLPDDSLYPVAYALASWFVSTGYIDEAYMYELHHPNRDVPPQIVLAVNAAHEAVLEDALIRIACDAGLTSNMFQVCFLPQEPSHRAGISGLQLEPFYRRPAST